MPSTTFKHIPLPCPTEQIRLLKLQPGTGIIRLDMRSYRLAESPEFVALSYEWGDGLEMHNIVIDGATLKIRQSLRDALEHIRILQTDRSSTRLFDEDSPLFWIDAITIDQSNTAEKAHQVSIMGNIFRQASHVIAWLGLEQRGDDSALAMEHLSTVPEDYLTEKDYSDRKRLRWTVRLSAEAEAIGKLCTRSYFQRLWIIQECVLARKLHLVCGLQYCSWMHLYNFNRFLCPEFSNKLAYNLFNAKLEFERDWKGSSIQKAMTSILKVAAEKHCSRFHDRIYGLLGILQQSFQSTGIVVDYAVSYEELMIKTAEFLTSDPEDDDPSTIPFWIQKVVQPPPDIEGKVAWYWQITEIMQKLDADVIKGFHKLETLDGDKERALTFHMICWIVGGYGVDLFSPVKDTTSLNTATTMPTICLESLEYEESIRENNRIFIMHMRCTTGVLKYCISLTHRPREPYALSLYYMMTEANSWECRSLLETYSEHVQSLGRMRESLKTSTKASDLEIQTQLPIQVEWMAFSNLLAQHFLSKFYRNTTQSNRKTRTDGFVRRIDPVGKALGTFLSESLFSKYRMSVAKTFDELPANALKSVEIEVTNSNEADHGPDFGKNILVAALYDNDA